MMEWKKVKLGEVCEILDNKRVPLSTMQRESMKGSYPYYGAQGVIDYINKYLFDEELLLVAEDGANLETRNEDIAQIARGKYWVNNHAHILKENGCIPLNLLAYMLNHMDIQPYITGSAQPKLNQANLVKIELNIPDEDSQRRIAAILSSLDAQIENNNRINRNLEAQAQALFKSWFVDFAPWGGAMPEGWKKGKLGEICTFKRGKNLLSKDAINEGVPVVAGGMEPACYHNMANTGAPVITISGSGANAGFMRMYHVPVWASDCSFIDVSCPNMYFVYCFLSCNEKLLRHAQTGAVQPHVKPSDIHDFDIIIPLAETIHEFQSKVQPLFLQVGNNTEANARLASLRDTLLPKLMKGEIEV